MAIPLSKLAAIPLPIGLQ